MKCLRMRVARVLMLLLCGYGQVMRGVSYFNYRTVGDDAARDMVAREEYMNLCGRDDYYGAFDLTVQYAQTFQSNKLAKFLFGPDVAGGSGCPANITISGSRAQGRGANDWLADYFGLPTDFVSTVYLKPVIKNWVGTLDWYVGLDRCMQNAYFRLQASFVNTRWDLQAREQVSNPGTNGYDFGYYSPNYIFREQLLADALSFLSGDQVPMLTIPDNTGTGINWQHAGTGGTYFTTPEIFQPLIAGRWAESSCLFKQPLTKAGVADLTMLLGYNFVCEDRGFFGLNLRVVAPTGTTPNGQYFFEPVVGNGHSWELGAGLCAYASLWQSKKSASTFDLYIDGHVTHLFKACQKRSFDLCAQGLNSRYMLAQNMVPATNTLGGVAVVCGASDDVFTDCSGEPETLSNFQFGNILAPVANVTYSRVKVNSAVQGDVVVKFAFSNNEGFGVDFGYNFFGRSHEKICRVGHCGQTDPLDGSSWALKGDAFVYGFGPGPVPVALAATENNATIHGGTNGFMPGVSSLGQYVSDPTSTVNVAQDLNPGIDNPAFAVAVINPANGVQPVVDYLGFDAVSQQSTSIQPKLLSAADLDLRGMSTITHKVFAHLNFEWNDCCEKCVPYLGFGGYAEFSQNHCASSSTDCGSSSCGTSSCATSCGSASSCGNSCGNSCGISSGCDSSTGCGFSSGCASSCSSSDNKSFRGGASQWSLWVKTGIAFD